jgi:MFS family permease
LQWCFPEVASEPHNTAVYWALHSLGAKSVLILLMATVSALPYTLFTLPAGAVADMVDRKRILLVVQLWHACIAVALAVLWMAHLLNPYIILTSAFLFSAFILLLNSCLMILVHRPFVFLLVAALGGMGWTLSASELWVASQRAMPGWARGRMNATMVMVSQAATALGGIVWGLAAHHVGVVLTFLGAAAVGLVIMIIVRTVPGLQISIDFTKSVSFESAPV